MGHQRIQRITRITFRISIHPDWQIDNTVENLIQYLPFGHIELVFFLRLSRHQIAWISLTITTTVIK